MSLDLILGEGATEKFYSALGQPEVIYYSDWEYDPTPPPGIFPSLDLSNPNDIQVIPVSTEVPWPGEGIWKAATVVWSDQVTQQIFFQDKKIHWGGGLCQEGGGETGDSLKRLASQEMKEFLATYIDHMKVQLPNVPVFYSRFLLAGFEIESETDSQVIIAATLKDPNSKMAELFNWRINGTIPEEEPAWRTQVRADMGLEKLFPND